MTVSSSRWSASRQSPRASSIERTMRATWWTRPSRPMGSGSASASAATAASPQRTLSAMTSDGAESAVVVRLPIPSALERIRRRLDPVAGVGIPAHVTILYPIRGPGRAGRRGASRACGDRRTATNPSASVRAGRALARRGLPRAGARGPVLATDRRTWSRPSPTILRMAEHSTRSIPHLTMTESADGAARRDRRRGRALAPVRAAGDAARGARRRRHRPMAQPLADPARDQTVMSSRCSPQATRSRSLISPTVAWARTASRIGRHQVAVAARGGLQAVHGRRPVLCRPLGSHPPDPLDLTALAVGVDPVELRRRQTSSSRKRLTPTTTWSPDSIARWTR